MGRRIKKQNTFGTTRYLWAGDQLAQETRNNIKKTYIYEPHSFKPVALVQDDEVYHYHLDHLGTPRELSNEQGKIVWKVRYKTYGNIALKETEEIENNIRFQGQYFDEETGLHYNRHRYYNPDTGQFISQDPIGLLGGINNYQYAPNPVGWIDPFGLSCKNWNDFQAKNKGIFNKDNHLAGDDNYSADASAGWEAYKDAYRNNDTMVIGALTETANYKSTPGMNVLDSSRWTLGANDAWVQGGIDRRATFMLASPTTKNNLWDTAKNRPRVYAREIKQLTKAGYKRVGNTMVPPSTI